ncbi:MAG: NAD(P)/FAD-dependent oxidoreductase [Pseudomonadota bacterium]|nr:NAD(P)/FAD-dependent oxidoreductase [Pseudomonadota bacterium]
MIETDIVIIGAGPVGLFTVFEAGLLKLRCHLVDVLPRPGGQCIELYPKKPIYDIPGFPDILAEDLVYNLLKQGEQFQPGFTLGESVISLQKQIDGRFLLTTDKHTQLIAPVVAIAGGLGCFQPRKPEIARLETFEQKGIDYSVKHPQDYQHKKVVIAGGGDSALDWTVCLADYVSELTLVHRRNAFRGAPATVDHVQSLVRQGKVTLCTPAEVVALHGDGHLEAVTINHNQQDKQLKVDHFLPLFGMSPKLDVFREWGLNLEKNAIVVNPRDYQTNIPGVYAIGDVNTYPGKLKLILCGFHEATLMCHAAFEMINPGVKSSLRYTTVVGVEGFDGTHKPAHKSVLKSFE